MEVKEREATGVLKDMLNNITNEDIRNARLQLAADEYVGHPQEIDEDLTVYCKREAFKDGALWQRNHVWHHADEEPSDRAVCLTVNKRGSKDIVTYSKKFFYKGHVIAEPCKLYRLTEIEMWAYIKDLLPDTDK